MSKLEELIRALCPNGVEYKKLGEIATVLRGASPRPIKKYITKDSDGVNWIKIGDVPVGSKYITQSEEKITKEGAEKSRYVRKGDFILSNSMSFGRPYILAIDGCIHDGWLSISNFKDVFLSDYLYYLLSSSAIQQEMKKRASFGGAVQNLNADIVKALVLPVPPIEVQSEIVRMLDSYTESVVELQRQLTAELTARKAQYSHYRDKLLSYTSTAQMEKLGDTCEMKAGKAIASGLISDERTEETPIKCYGGNGVRGYVKNANENGSYPIIGRQGALCGNVKYAEGQFYATEHAVVVKPKEKYNPRFLYHLLTNMNLNQYKSAGAQPGLAVKNIAELVAPVPPLDVQNRIVNVLDNFEKICSALNIGLPAEIEARQKQYEYYRDKLLTFAETGNTILSRAEQSRAEQSRAEQSRAEQSRSEH